MDGERLGDGLVIAEGPYFDDLHHGQTFTAPAMTLTGGRAAVHQAIAGDRLALALDETLARAVTGEAKVAHPALVWDTAIGQSSVVTHHVKANLFYRGLAFRRFPLIGDTLRTTTTVAGLRQNRARDGRAPTGLAVLRIVTVDQAGRPVLDFWRCAMIPLRDPAGLTGHDDDLDGIGAAPDGQATADLVAGWHLSAFGSGTRFTDLAAGDRFEVAGGDVVSAAPELARLTLNIAAVHHDAGAAGGRRLVFGGHTIGVALSQATRALPGMVTVAGWHGCDHLGPVHEGDTLFSTVTVDGLDPLPRGGGLVDLRSQVASGDDRRPVLDWRYVAVFA